MKKYEEFINLTEEELNLVSQVITLIESGDDENINLGISLFKTSKLWKRIKPRTLWIPLYLNWNIVCPTVTSSAEAKSKCFNVDWNFSEYGQYHPFGILRILDALKTKQPLYRIK